MGQWVGVPHPYTLFLPSASTRGHTAHCPRLRSRANSRQSIPKKFPTASRPTAGLSLRSAFTMSRGRTPHWTDRPRPRHTAERRPWGGGKAEQRLAHIPVAAAADDRTKANPVARRPIGILPTSFALHQEMTWPFQLSFALLRTQEQHISTAIKSNTMWWTISGILLAVSGLVTATTLWNQIHEKRKLLLLGLLMIGIVALNLSSHFEATHNDETIENLREKLHSAEQKIIENDIVRRKLVEYGDIAKLNADGSTGIVKKGGGLSGGDTEITPKAKKMWIYSGENGNTRHPKCDRDGMQQAKRLTNEHPRFPFSHYVLAACRRAENDAAWVTSAQRALDILEFTTQVPSHNRHHTLTKRRLFEWLTMVEGN